MKTRNLLLAMLLVVALALPTLGLAEVTVSPPGEFPIVSEPITLKMVAGQSPVQVNFADMVILKNFEEKSGIHIEWEMVPQDMLAERRNILFASLDLPDAMMRMSIPALDQASYADQGLLMPLNDLIEEWAPNLQHWFEKYPDVEEGLKLADGQIYTLPYVFDHPAITIGHRIFFNGEALDAVGMDIPTTLDEYFDLLMALKELDYNENGEQDEFPLVGADYAQFDWVFKGSFGLGTRGTRHEYVDVDPETGDLRFIYTSDRYKALLEYVNKLYENGLIDPAMFTYNVETGGDFAQLIAKGEQGRALTYIFANHTAVGDVYGQYARGMTEALEGPFGDKMFTSFGSALGGSSGAGGTFAIMADNPYPEATMRWVDYWYSDEGIIEFFMGVEGETYEVTDDGEYVYTDYVMNNPDGIMFEQVLGGYVPWAGIAPPSVAHEKYFKGGEMLPITKDSAEALQPYGPEVIWPVLRLDAELSDEMLTLQNDIKTYRNENRAAFMTGARSLDEWDDYVAGYEKIGLSRYMEIYQEYIDGKGWE